MRERNVRGGDRTQRSIFLFWAPLAATWLMMAVEGPFLAAVIARLSDPEFNLAAYGVAFAFALLAEAPVIMLMSASTALVDDANSLRRLRRFTFGLIAVVTFGMVVMLTPPVYDFMMRDLLALPEEVAGRTYTALWILLPWPGAIGYRRFYQGLLIRAGRPRLVAYGTVLRLTAMGGTAIVLFLTLAPAGATVGAAALAAGVCAEAGAASRATCGIRVVLCLPAVRRGATCRSALGGHASSIVATSRVTSSSLSSRPRRSSSRCRFRSPRIQTPSCRTPAWARPASTRRGVTWEGGNPAALSTSSTAPH